DGFRNSFRIIAKQNSFQKEGELFVIDSDFDVLYTIEPSPEYRAALDMYVQIKGRLPASYRNLEEAYKEFCKRIHDEMPKLPLCRDYFAMLGVITFFSCYFSTLKKHQKVPVLDSRKSLPLKGSPPLFPHLPISGSAPEVVKLTSAQATQILIEVLKPKLQKYFSQIRWDHFHSRPLLAPNEKRELEVVLCKEIRNQLVKSVSVERLFKTYIFEDKELDEAIKKYAESILSKIESLIISRIDHLKSEFINSIPKLVNDSFNLSGFNDIFTKERNTFELWIANIDTDSVYNLKTHPESERKLISLLRPLGTHRTQPEQARAVLSFTQSKGTTSSERAYTFAEMHDSVIASNGDIHYGRLILKLIYENYELNISDTISIVNDRLANEKISFPPFVHQFPVPTARLFSEVSRSESTKSQRIVGGCGVKLETQSIRVSSIAKEILQTHAPALYKMPTETWTKISYGGTSHGHVFRLQFQNIPAGMLDDFQWMESQLLLPEGLSDEVIEEKERIEEAIKLEKKEDFAQAIEASQKLHEMRDRNHLTLVHQAASLQDPFYLTTLIAKGKGLSLTSVDCYGYQPIHYAAMHGSLLSLQLLIRMKGKEQINVKSHNGSTPLHTAVLHGQKEVVAFLIKIGALFTALSDGYTPLHSALHEGDFSIIDEVLASTQAKGVINQITREGGTPLMIACELDSDELVKRMISLGADPSMARWDGVTCLEIAVSRHCIPVMKVLLEHVEPSMQALEAIVREGTLEEVRLVLSKEQLFELRNAQKDTSLHIAVAHGNQEVALALIQERPSPAFLALVNKEGETAFTLAAAYSEWEVLEELKGKYDHTRDELLKVCRRLLLKEYKPLVLDILKECKLNEAELVEFATLAAQACNSLALYAMTDQLGVNLDKVIGQHGWKIEHYFARSGDGLFLFSRVPPDGDILMRLPEEEGGKTLPYIAGESGQCRLLRDFLEGMIERKIPLEGHYKDRHLFYSVIETANLDGVQLILKMYAEDKKELVNVPLELS
ncbi:MAG: ankyrin repeat domain-containing protein, partial [Verrucomicrobia bacterium]|nr:ankyrin repeat domain-containing protein [Verrucomicrobiota bacterium]